MTSLSRIPAYDRLIDQQRGHLFPWVPVCLGIGIAGYFALKQEPSALHWCVLGVLFVVAVGWAGWTRSVVSTAVALVVLGVLLAGARTWAVADHKLSGRYYGPIEGRIVAIDRSQSDAVRLTLDRVVLLEKGPGETPGRVRVALHGTQGFITPEPGLTVIMTGHLGPPGGPVEPGGYDFRRQAWFQGLGAVGYTRTPVLVIAPREGRDVAIAVYHLRMQISAAVRQAIPGRAGAFAAAILTGDRSSIDLDTRQHLRRTNLAHLLAISGLHMAMLTGSVFLALRTLLALVPGLALRHRTKKIAAVGALLIGAMYLVLSGSSVATERAFIMVAVMYLAVLMDKRAITLRAVALAALIVLLFQPEALMGPGFQMSFAATTALVVCYRAMGDAARWRTQPLLVREVGGVALSSFIAGSATAPIAAAHFNMLPHYGLVANVLAVPLMGMVVMPAALFAAVLWPFGLAGPALTAMGWSIEGILRVAEFVSDWRGAVSYVPAPQHWLLPTLSFGALVWALWQGRGRYVGLGVLVIMLVLWTQTERPAVLVSENGVLIGVKTEGGRALSKPRGDSFSAQSWLENDGDPISQEDAFARNAFRVAGRVRMVNVAGVRIVHATGKVATATVLSECLPDDLVIVNAYADRETGCHVYDRSKLSDTGSLAIHITDDQQLRIVTAREAAGTRPWSQ